MSEIYARGPVTCSMYAHMPDFMDYHGGIIVDRTKFQPGNTTHVISLLGWGEENGTPFWIGRNSFGSVRCACGSIHRNEGMRTALSCVVLQVWGENGWFRIIRGINSLNIESHCGWVTPLL